jgi:hypothetical protein
MTLFNQWIYRSNEKIFLPFSLSSSFSGISLDCFDVIKTHQIRMIFLNPFQICIRFVVIFYSISDGSSSCNSPRIYLLVAISLLWYSHGLGALQLRP